VPAEATFQFPGGLADHLAEQTAGANASPPSPLPGAGFPASEMNGRVEWAIAWPVWSEGAYSYYCNTIPTPDGGTHEQGLRAR
jgi:topoisomerase-4 subunit B